jgi:catechol 2,3-dioxygenase-like lactoylglutathione lyase family enzyme
MEDSMKIKRFDHFSFTVADLADSNEFYERLGFEPHKSYISAGRDAEEGTETKDAEIEISWLRHPDGGPMLELLRYRNMPVSAAAHNSTVGAAHICLCVEDVNSEVDRLRSEGVTFVSPPHSDDFGVIWVYMRDPDGNVVELLQDPQ